MNVPLLFKDIAEVVLFKITCKQGYICGHITLLMWTSVYVIVSSVHQDMSGLLPVVYQVGHIDNCVCAFIALGLFILCF